MRRVLSFVCRAETERGLSRKHIVESVQGSLERLGLQYVDIVFAHGRDASTSIEGEMKSLTKYDRLTLSHGKGRDKLPSKQGFL